MGIFNLVVSHFYTPPPSIKLTAQRIKLDGVEHMKECRAISSKEAKPHNSTIDKQKLVVTTGYEGNNFRYADRARLIL